MDNPFGPGEAVERDPWIFFHVNDRVTSPKIDVALLAMVEGYATKSKTPRANIKCQLVASQMRVAFANIALKTGSSSPGELR